MLARGGTVNIFHSSRAPKRSMFLTFFPINFSRASSRLFFTLKFCTASISFLSFTRASPKFLYIHNLVIAFPVPRTMPSSATSPPAPKRQRTTPSHPPGNPGPLNENQVRTHIYIVPTYEPVPDVKFDYYYTSVRRS